jgi:hypothetical protein
MREREMRQRVERFLQTRLRSMLLPATLGLGLAVGACNSDGLSTDDGGDKTVNKDAGSVAPMYLAQIPDAGSELPMPVPYYGTVTLPDAGPVGRYGAQMMPDASPADANRVIAVYSVPLPRS